MLNEVKKIDELVVTSTGIFSRLETMGVKIGCIREPRRIPTKSRTPMPAKIIFAGGNA
jgi:hypothetical protein